MKGKPTQKSSVLPYDKRRKLFFKPCKTKKEFSAWLKYFLNIHLPDITVSRYATTNPLDAAWNIYNICVNNDNPQNLQDLIYCASRGSGKTLGAGIVEFMVMIHDKRSVCHIGAILQQAKRCFEYQQGFYNNPKIKDILYPVKDNLDPKTQKPYPQIIMRETMEKSVFNITDQQVSIEVLPLTMKSVNGPHVPLVFVDEIDTVSGEQAKAYREISGILDSRSGKKPLRIGISTRKSRYGLMNKQIEEAEKAGRKVEYWTALEFTERCSDNRSGTTEVDAYVLQDQMEVLSKSEFDKKDKLKQKEYVHHKLYDGCLKCPLAAICLTDLKKQNSKSPMLKTIDELAQKVRSEGADWALSQLMNLKPSVEGVVFREYEEKIHVKNWNQMWRILTGKEFPGECTHDMFVKKCHELNLSCYAGIDWGFSSPNTVVYFFVDKRENIYVVKCDGMTFVSQPSWIHYIKTKYHNMYRCQLYVPDAADQGAIQEMRKSGLPVANQADKGSINTGIQVIKKFLKIPGSIEPKLFFAKETCGPILNEMTLYHYKLDAAGVPTDDPDTEHDHYIDALRYPMALMFSKNTLILGSGLDLERAQLPVDTNGNFTKMPDASEFAESKGIRFQESEPDISKLGKIGKISELDDSDDESGGSGSFVWTF